VALEVRRALEKVSTVGTAARALSRLAAQAPIAAKTGTAGFHHGTVWQGEGGSWCVSADSATGLVSAVRVRWISGHPFELEGGQSAAYVTRHFLEKARSFYRKETNE
jgi:hypothetical protein